MSAGEISRACTVCGETDETARLEHCPVCRKDFCPDCAYRGTGRRFCSDVCARTFFYGDIDDDEGTDTDD
ncbi:MAG: hypothetical protein QOI24_4276 [Acidobacteriota bacterium]|jgi:hypothetical protein|nr:hypothetical protein [Acidobacteriota bacterium]